jgi:4-hydroxy-tetrahydrodipicolinate synthase
MPMLLRGLSAFPITPANAEGRVDVDAVRKLVAPLCAAKVNSVGLLGSTGTYAYLSRSERRRALDAALEEAAGQVPILVGVGALRTDEAVRLAQDARAAGAAAGLLAPVSYTPLTEDEVFEHFATVARESRLPLCIYDNPSTTHFRFSPALIGRLSRLPDIIAVKSPAPEPQAVAAHLADLRRVVPDGFSLGYSGDWNSVEALIAGGDA